MNMELQKEFTNNLPKLFRRYDIVLAYLFGSQAQGTDGPLSDIDIAVLFSKDVLKSQYGRRQCFLTADLIGILHHNDVDVVVLNQATPLLKHNVLCHGKVLFDKEARIDFEVQAQREYFDTAYLRRMQNIAFLEKIKSQNPVLFEKKGES